MPASCASAPMLCRARGQGRIGQNTIRVAQEGPRGKYTCSKRASDLTDTFIRGRPPDPPRKRGHNVGSPERRRHGARLTRRGGFVASRWRAARRGRRWPPPSRPASSSRKPSRDWTIPGQGGRRRGIGGLRRIDGLEHALRGDRLCRRRAREPWRRPGQRERCHKLKVRGALSKGGGGALSNADSAYLDQAQAASCAFEAGELHP